MKKHPFEYHRPTYKMVDRMTEVRQHCKSLHDLLRELEGQGEITPRECALAITNLEQVSMWANKGIVLVDEEMMMPGSDTKPRLVMEPKPEFMPIALAHNHRNEVAGLGDAPQPYFTTYYFKRETLQEMVRDLNDYLSSTDTVETTEEPA